MDRLLVSIARLIGALTGAFAGIVAVQLMRMRRMQFLPGWPGFWINHVVHPTRRTAPGTASAPRLRMAMLGDSTTIGVGVEHPGHALPYLVAQRVADAESRDVHVVSYGWSGARVTDLVRSQLPRALEPLRTTESEPFLPGADLVVVVVGANDATHNTPPNRYRDDLRTTLEGIRRAAPTARVVLAGIPAFRGALPALEPLIFLADQYARLLRRISRTEATRIGAAYADLHGDVASLIEGRADVLSSDNFHPSVVGYDAWAEVIFRALQSDSSAAEASVEAAGV
ncbi:MAG: SGNH/GDSL hydrolase family protein [Candidatus Limnocylindria bacterium]